MFLLHCSATPRSPCSTFPIPPHPMGAAAPDTWSSSSLFAWARGQSGRDNIYLFHLSLSRAAAAFSRLTGTQRQRRRHDAHVPNYIAMPSLGEKEKKRKKVRLPSLAAAVVLPSEYRSCCHPSREEKRREGRGVQPRSSLCQPRSTTS
jgi:hypothetical protein